MSVLTGCPEDISAETLSALGDGGLTDSEAARLRAHVAGCSACQRRLRAFSAVSKLVSEQRIPSARAVDVAAVRGETRRRSASRPPMKRWRPARALWGGLGAVVAAALLIAAFSQVLARLGPLTPAATATPSPVTFAWSMRTLPPGLSAPTQGPPTVNFTSQAFYQVNFAVAPASGQSAWICALASDGTVTVWATTDQARSWRIADHFQPLATPTPINGCFLEPDQVSPTTVAMSVTWGNGAIGAQHIASYISRDGGQTWMEIGGAESGAIPALATFGKRTYAILSGQTFGGRMYQVMVSDDGLRTWRNITPRDDFTQLTSLLADPATGDLLVSPSHPPFATQAPNGDTVWRTDNGGATWMRLTSPASFDVEFQAWLPEARQWRVCGAIVNSVEAIQCSDDFGKTWRVYGSLDGIPATLQKSCDVVRAIAPDGSMFAQCGHAVVTPTAGQAAAWTLYRLKPSATIWLPLGRLPSQGPANAGAIFVTGDLSSSAGALWYSDPQSGILAVAVLPS